MRLNALVQLVGSVILSIASLITSVLITRNLGYFDRTIYGIYMVSLGQIFVFIQLGLPGAFNVIGLGVLKLANKQQILLLLAKRSSPLFLFALLTNFLFDLNVPRVCFKYRICYVAYYANRPSISFYYLSRIHRTKLDFATVFGNMEFVNCDDIYSCLPAVQESHTAAGVHC